MKTPLCVAAMLGFFHANAIAQSPGDSEDGLLFRIDSRIGFLITGSEGFADRPLFQVDGGLQFGRARPGGPPALGITLGASIESGEIFARTASISTRFLAGIELPWAIGGSATRRNAVEFVPAIQVGYQHAFEDDGRNGLTLRVAPGIRVLQSTRTMFLTFEPLSFVLLAAPAPAEDLGDDRFGVELGVLKFGWRF